MYMAYISETRTVLVHAHTQRKQTIRCYAQSNPTFTRNNISGFICFCAAYRNINGFCSC